MDAPNGAVSGGLHHGPLDLTMARAAEGGARQTAMKLVPKSPGLFVTAGAVAGVQGGFTRSALRGGNSATGAPVNSAAAMRRAVRISSSASEREWIILPADGFAASLVSREVRPN